MEGTVCDGTGLPVVVPVRLADEEPLTVVEPVVVGVAVVAFRPLELEVDEPVIVGFMVLAVGELGAVGLEVTELLMPGLVVLAVGLLVLAMGMLVLA